MYGYRLNQVAYPHYWSEPLLPQRNSLVVKALNDVKPWIKLDHMKQTVGTHAINLMDFNIFYSVWILPTYHNQLYGLCIKQRPRLAYIFSLLMLTAFDISINGSFIYRRLKQPANALITSVDAQVDLSLCLMHMFNVDIITSRLVDTCLLFSNHLVLRPKLG